MMGGMRSAGVYVRISSDPEGKALGIERQRQDCQELAQSKGWRVVDVYPDNDQSATRGKPRLQYARLLADLRCGRIDAVVVWDLDRLHRRPVELEDFLDLVKARGVALASVGGDVDLGTEQGVLIAGIKAQVGRYESQQISRRVRRKQQELRDAGEPFGGGHRPYGYDKPRKKVIEREAKVLREVADRLLAGSSLRSIVEDLNRRGIKPARAERWTTTTLKAVVSKPRIAGLLTYQGKVLGRGTWPPILDEGTFERVLVALDRRRPTTRVTNARKHLLSGLVVCGVDGCDLPVQIAHQSSGVLGYKCPRAHLARNQRHLDAHVRQEVIRYAAEHPIRVGDWQDPEQAALSAQIAALEARKAEAADQFVDGTLPPDMLRRIGSRLQAEIDALQERQVTGAAVAFDVEWVALDLADAWDDMPLHQQRAAILLYAQRIALLPVKARGRGFDPSSVEIVFRGTNRVRWTGIVER